MNVAVPAFCVLALCAGAGGLELGIKLAVPGARLVGAVERDAYAAATLVARMEDATLDPAPLWDNVVTFDGRPWRGTVDCVTAGFPCQPFSVAGKRRGTADERWIWPDIARIVGEVRPRVVFLENVPGLVRRGLDRVAGDLAALGFDQEWDVFSAAEVGAPHLRERLFLLAHARCGCDDANESQSVAGRNRATSLGDGRNPLADAECAERGPDAAGGDDFDRDDAGRQEAAGGDRECGIVVADAVRGRLGSGQRDAHARQPDAQRAGIAVGDAHRDGFTGLRREAGQRQRHPNGPDGAVGVGHADPDCERRGEGHIAQGLREWGTDADGACLLPLFPPGPSDAVGWATLLALDPSLEPAVRGSADGVADRLGRRGIPNRRHRLRVLGNGVVPMVSALAFLTLRDRLEMG